MQQLTQIEVETAQLSRRQKQKYNAEGIRMSDLGYKGPVSVGYTLCRVWLIPMLGNA